MVSNFTMDGAVLEGGYKHLAGLHTVPFLVLQTQGIVMQTKSRCGFVQINPGSHVVSRSGKEDTGKRTFMQTGRIHMETEYRACTV
jgi:hypothetical protein